jgi:hypothetical protein
MRNSGYAHLSDFDLLVKRAAELEDLLLAHDREIKSLRRMVQGGNDVTVSQPGPSSIPMNRTESRQPWRREAADDGLGEEGLEIPSHTDPARQRRKVVVQSPNEEGATMTKALGELNVDERDSDRPFIHHSRPPSGAPSLADHNAALVLEVGSTGVYSEATEADRVVPLPGHGTQSSLEPGARDHA